MLPNQNYSTYSPVMYPPGAGAPPLSTEHSELSFFAFFEIRD